MSEITLVPSLPAQSFAELQELAKQLAKVTKEFQVDIVDGQFVPLKAWPFTEKNPTAELDKVSELPDELAIEMDCMVMHPEQYLDQLAELGVRRVIVHMGSTDKLPEIILHARTHNYQIGLAFTNDIPLAKVGPEIPEVDFIQVMGIAKVGKQGQPFDERTLQTVSTLRTQFPDLEIAIDGSVNSDTIEKLVTAGATRLAPGSAVAKAADPKASFLALRELAASQ